MSEEIKRINIGAVPVDGISVQASPGKMITRLHLDLADDGITLAMVGAASSLTTGNRHSLEIKKGSDGISLAMVGAASAAEVG